MMQDQVPTQAGEVATAADLGGVVHDFSAISLFLQADFIVKSVMVLLLLASVYSWAIMYEKWRTYRRVRQLADKFEDVFWSGNSLEDLYEGVSKQPDHPLAMVFAAAMREWQRSLSGKGLGRLGASLSERIETVMRVTVQREMEHLEHRLSFLATVGSVAPFVGLFGTVWGIMNSFESIALSQNTSLAVVAPGIAEALFATALGLLAAIPAVVAYNKLTGDLGRYATRLENFSDEFSAVISRQLDEKV